jgi:hypothetical protein
VDDSLVIALQICCTKLQQGRAAREAVYPVTSFPGTSMQLILTPSGASAIVRIIKSS